LRLWVAAAIAVLFAAGTAHEPHAESPPPAVRSFSLEGLARISDYIRNEITSGKIPGAILLIQQHGKPVYFEKFGVRDVATQLSMSADTIFRLYSMSKPITSVAAMMLVEDGKLGLADPVAKYIPAFADMKVGVEKPGDNGKVTLALEPLDRPITIEDLMRHTSGLTYGFYGDSAVRKLYAQADLFNGDSDQCRIRRADREAAAGGAAGNAVGLRPFDRRPRTRHRGGVGPVIISVREGAPARSAGDARYRLLRRR
jgi:CubicO group peptidase (beta-lactamase class C family)